jgi:hypothetical protein
VFDMGYPFWIRLDSKNDVGRVMGFTGSILYEEYFLDILEQYEITKLNLVTVEINGKTYPSSKLDSIFAKLEN